MMLQENLYPPPLLFLQDQWCFFTQLMLSWLQQRSLLSCFRWQRLLMRLQMLWLHHHHHNWSCFDTLYFLGNKCFTCPNGSVTIFGLLRFIVLSKITNYQSFSCYALIAVQLFISFILVKNIGICNRTTFEGSAYYI